MWYNQKKGDKKYFNPRPPRGGRRGWIRGSAVGLGISIHAPREGGDIDTLACMWTDAYFNPRPPRGGRPQFSLRTLTRRNFNPRPPRGGRRRWTHRQNQIQTFQSTPPARGATKADSLCWCIKRFQSTPPARGATRRRSPPARWRRISIHAPREGGDPITTISPCAHGCISIHAPREGGDVLPPEMGGIFVAFQSTPPARGATPEQIRPVQSITISIHAPREGGDYNWQMQNLRL